MAIVIQPYRKEHEPAVKDFNQRIQDAGADKDLVFYKSSEPRWLPAGGSSSLYNEFFVALDAGAVRGGYALKHQEFSLRDGTIRPVGYYHHPLSEGIVNKSHAIVGSLLLRDAMRREPMLYCLGMGGYDRPLPKMLMGLGWSHCLVPFFFRVVHPSRFLKEMQALRSSPARRLAMNFAAHSGFGWAAMKLHGAYKQAFAPKTSGISVTEIDEFSDWADLLWQRTKGAYALTAVRGAASLRLLYPASDQHFTRLRLQRGSQDIGWVVVGERRADSKYGSMRVGSIVDCWAAPEDAFAVVEGGANALERLGVDLIVSNQSHAAWCDAFRKAGFIEAQSNFIFAASKKLTELLQPFEKTRRQIHFTRADGDGLPRNF